MTREEVATVRCGYTIVAWTDEEGVEYSGWVIGHSLDGFQVMDDGRIRTVKPSEATLLVVEVPPSHVAPGPQVQQPGALGRSTTANPKQIMVPAGVSVMKNGSWE